jgi:hypothetical protein
MRGWSMQNTLNESNLETQHRDARWVGQHAPGIISTLGERRAVSISRDSQRSQMRAAFRSFARVEGTRVMFVRFRLTRMRWTSSLVPAPSTSSPANLTNRFEQMGVSVCFPQAQRRHRTQTQNPPETIQKRGSH